MGVLLKDENKLDEMVDIMDYTHKYVPMNQYVKDQDIQGQESVVVQAVDFHRELFGGDYLTSKRGRGAQRIRANSTNDLDKLKGLLPVSEDWHAKMCFLSVSTSIICFFKHACMMMLLFQVL